MPHDCCHVIAVTCSRSVCPLLGLADRNVPSHDNALLGAPSSARGVRLHSARCVYIYVNVLESGGVIKLILATGIDGPIRV